MRRLVLTMVMALAMPLAAWAGSAIVYDGKGRINSVVRDGPSGPIVYDGEGRIVSAVRSASGIGVVVIRDDRRRSGSIGTTLSGGVGSD